MLLALFPGSRPQELRRHLRLFADASRLVTRARPDVLPVIARVPGLSTKDYEREELPVVDDARALLAHARAALVKSGTATLEAALAGTPMVVAYRTSSATWALAKRLVNVPFVSLPNLIANARVVPERLQDEATSEGLARDVLPLLGDGDLRAAQLRSFADIRTLLGTPGVAERVADMAVDLLGVPA
jgi:lipid-A-disaccharide synthase